MRNMVDVDCVLIRETDAAYLIRSEKEEEIWVPKTQCSGVIVELMALNEFDEGETQTIAVAEWFAEREGLI